ncbi:MAG: hypothetical protein ACYC75_01380 [Minisyncoccota bacterium]
MRTTLPILIGVVVLIAGAYLFGQSTKSTAAQSNTPVGTTQTVAQPNQKTSVPQPDIVAYPIFCFNAYATLNNCSNGYAGGRSFFIVDKEHQQVTVWVPDSTPTNYTVAHRCAITDINNWSCVYDDDKTSSQAFGFRNGVYFDSVAPLDGMTQLWVSQQEWQKVHDDPSLLKS